MRDARRRAASACGLALAAMLLLAGCTSGQGPAAVRRSGDPRFTVDPDGILRLADDPTKPYGVTAIDYHFHDAHPTLPLSPGRTIIVTNEGRVRHNVSISGTDFTRDVEPGGRIVLRDVGELFGGPGPHAFICSYHANLGMKGTVIVAEG
jgi:plastocyanin